MRILKKEWSLLLRQYYLNFWTQINAENTGFVQCHSERREESDPQGHSERSEESHRVPSLRSGQASGFALRMTASLSSA